MSATLRAASGSSAENLFISLFEDVFGAEKTGYLYSQYPFFDIYQDSRFADFLLENGGRRVAIEIDDASHLPGHVSQVKHYDDLTKQNSMIHMGWAVYRWPVRIMQKQPERVKDELRIFLGSQPQFHAIADYLPTQRGRTFRLKEHQQEALDALAKMREAKETIALIHHATGTGKTVTAVSDAKRMGGRVLYIAHTKGLITQAADAFQALWPEASLGLYVDNASQYNMPYSLHRLFRLKDYHTGALVAAPMAQKSAEESLYARGERPDALIDWPVSAIDYELLDLFNWQEEAADMYIMNRECTEEAIYEQD